MVEKEEKKPSVSKDLEKVKSLIEKGKLDSTLSHLDSSDIQGSVKRVPKEVVRLMSHLLIGVKDVEKQIKTLRADQRIPVEMLLEAAKKYNGEEFSIEFLKQAVKDEKLRRDFGISFPKIIDPMRAKIDNTVNDVQIFPHMSLATNRIYTELSLLQNDELLFRTSAELDELLFLVMKLMGGARVAFETLPKERGRVKASVDIEACGRYLKQIVNYTRYVSEAISVVTHGPKKRKRVKSVISEGRQEKRKKTSRT